ncbi:hypothetical protein [Amycolatopsis sp. GM8]|uniref:hypothetical protein n=1 Tax=Amycolatopsis sp. GM8 TaxID=2896530 RepID=UPI001F3C25EB|nr:hypothetical protein [Amycolatopsis sp. GM8]
MNADQMNDLVHKPTASLDRDWTADERDSRDGRLRAPNGEWLHVRTNGWNSVRRGRIAINGILPPELRGNGRTAARQKTRSPWRPPGRHPDDQRDHTSLLPGYRDTLAKARVKKAEADTYHAKRDAMLADLQIVLGGRVLEHAPDKLHIGYGNDVVVRTDDVAFEAPVPHDTAVQFARLAPEYRTEC